MTEYKTLLPENKLLKRKVASLVQEPNQWKMVSFKKDTKRSSYFLDCLRLNFSYSLYILMWPNFLYPLD